MNFEVDEQGNSTSRPIVNGVPAFVAIRGGVLHAMVRAVDKQTFDALALQVGIKVLDEENNAYSAPGVTINEMGNFVITPGQYDEEGNELVPPVFDTRYHVNFWLSNDVVERNNWQNFCDEWSNNGTNGTANKNENSLLHQGIELIDPLSVATPSNILL